MSVAMPSRESWLAERRTLIGASDAASILGVGYQSPFAVWAEKTGAVECDDRDATEAMECGLALQPGILSLLRRRSGLDVIAEPDWSLRRHPYLSWLGCSLDAYVDDDEAGMGVVEAKNVGGYNASEWKDSEPPLRFNVQVQCQMAVTGATWAIVVGLIGGNRLVWHTVARDDTFIDRMVRALGEFWALVESRTPPPVDGSEHTARVLARMFPRDDGSVVSLPDEAREWDSALVALKAQRSAIDKNVTLLENQIKAALGEASEGLLPDGGRYTYRAQTRKEYVCPESTFRVLRRSSK